MQLATSLSGYFLDGIQIHSRKCFLDRHLRSIHSLSPSSQPVSASVFSSEDTFPFQWTPGRQPAPLLTPSIPYIYSLITSYSSHFLLPFLSQHPVRDVFSSPKELPMPTPTPRPSDSAAEFYSCICLLSHFSPMLAEPPLKGENK